MIRTWHGLPYSHLLDGGWSFPDLLLTLFAYGLVLAVPVAVALTVLGFAIGQEQSPGLLGKVSRWLDSRGP